MQQYNNNNRNRMLVLKSLLLVKLQGPLKLQRLLNLPRLLKPRLLRRTTKVRLPLRLRTSPTPEIRIEYQVEYQTKWQLTHVISEMTCNKCMGLLWLFVCC